MSGSPIGENLPPIGGSRLDRVRVALRSSLREGASNASSSAAPAAEPVADDAHVIGLNAGAPATDSHRSDRERVEHERQSRLKRWQETR